MRESAQMGNSHLRWVSGINGEERQHTRARVDPKRGGVTERGKSGDGREFGSAQEKEGGTSSARAVGSTGLEAGYVEICREEALAGLSSSEIDNYFDYFELEN